MSADGSSHEEWMDWKGKKDPTFDPAVVVSENRGDTVTGLSTSPDCSHVVVGGRNILKVFSIEEGFFREKHNLRVGRHPNLNHSASDVAWSTLDENLIATATTAGSVVTWRLDKFGKNKIDLVYHAHKRTTHTVCFHKTDVNYLLSGSQDASAKLFDMRKPDSYATSFETKGNVDPIRDVEFSPHNGSYFVSVDEGGNVRFWDIRNSARPVTMFTAHAGPVYSVDFHPTSKSWLATGGRDNVIKVWTYDSNTFRISDPQQETIQTTSSVNVVRWRPARAWQLASSSLIGDRVVHVWDLRRPFIPFASFDHKDVVTGICWLNDPHTFLSCGKDMLLKLNKFKVADRPANYASPIGLDISPQGDVAWAVCKNPNLSGRKNAALSPQKSIVGYLGFAGVKTHDEFVSPANYESHMNMFMRTNSDPIYSFEWFVDTAKQYKLWGLPFSQLCQHNADVATKLNRPQVAATWKMLTTLYDFHEDAQRQAPPDGLKENKSGDRLQSESVTPAVSFGLELGSAIETEGTEEDNMTTDTGMGWDSSKSTPYSDPRTRVHHRSATSGGAVQHSDFFFGTAEHNIKDMINFEAYLDDASDWNVNREAFEPKLDLLSTENFGTGMNTHFSSSPVENGHSPSAVGSIMDPLPIVVRPPSTLTVSVNAKFPLLDPEAMVKAMLEYYAEMGDVQMTVSVLLVLGERGKNLVDTNLQEHWYLAYLDMLDHFELWTTSALLIKICPLQAIAELSLQGTALSIGCSRCQKFSGPVGWFCDRCKQLTAGCSICQNPVRSLWTWCQICGHGGHMEHLQHWFSKHQFCPTGCGHKCEYDLFAKHL